MAKNDLLSDAEILKLVREYDETRSQKALLEKRMKEIGDAIKKYVSTVGAKDSKGSYYSDDDTFVFGSMARTTVKLNPERALAFLKEKGFTDAIETQEFVNEEKLNALVGEKKIKMKDFESLVDRSVSYSTFVKKKEDMDELPEVIQSKLSHSAPSGGAKKPVLRAKKRSGK